MSVVNTTEETTVEEERPEELTASINRTICTPELASRLSAQSNKTGAPKAWLVRRALEFYLDHKEQE